MRDWDQIEPRRREFAHRLSQRITEMGFSNESFADQLNTTPDIIIEIRSGYLDLPIAWVTVVAGALKLDSHKLMEDALALFLPTVAFSAADAMMKSISPDEYAVIELIREYNGRQSSPMSDPFILEGIREMLNSLQNNASDA